MASFKVGMASRYLGLTNKDHSILRSRLSLSFFLTGASLSGWRWGRCVPCATCPSCSSPSRLVVQSPQCRYSSLCLASRTWCSSRWTSVTDPVTHLPVQVHFRQPGTPDLARLHTGSRNGFSATTSGRKATFSCFTYMADNEEEVMMKKFCSQPTCGP